MKRDSSVMVVELIWQKARALRVTLHNCVVSVHNLLSSWVDELADQLVTSAAEACSNHSDLVINALDEQVLFTSAQKAYFDVLIELQLGVEWEGE